VLRLTGNWTEAGVTWRNQPATAGAAAATTSGSGTLEWNVTSQVRSMYSGANHGFLVRDSLEGGEGVDQNFHSREKDNNTPELEIKFG
jgi:hypothetical protein